MVPPRKDNTALIVVLVVVVLVIIPVIASAVLYIMVSGLMSSPAPARPIVTLMLSNETATAATILVTGTQPAVAPTNFKVNLEADSTFGTAVSLPSASGVPVSVYVSTFGSPFQVRWIDAGTDGVISAGDQFVIGYSAGLGTGVSVTFLLMWSDGATISTLTWVT